MQLVISRPACSCTHENDRDGCTFRVAWTINPHMRVGAVNPMRARAQHAAFVDALRRAGANVTQLPFLHGAFDCVFMKDSAILARTGESISALPATVHCAERANEPAARAAQLGRLGVHTAPPLATQLEGGDVVVIPHRRLALLGHGVRSEVASAPGLARFLGHAVIPLELRDAALFHLDTALAVLADDTLLLCEEAFTAAALRTIASLGFRRTVTVSTAEAMRFVLNFVEVDETIVTGTESIAMAGVWTGLGRRCVVSPLDEFQLAGGSAACLVARVHERVAEVRAAGRVAA